MTLLVWHGLAEFCADCALQDKCPRATLAEVEACPLVQWQYAEDAGEAKPALRRKIERDPVRNALMARDTEDIILKPGGGEVNVRARVREIHTHKGDPK